MDHKMEIISALEKMQKKEIADKQPFKARAYTKVIRQLKALKTPITSIADIDGIEGIGGGIKKKIEEILATGKLIQAEEYDNRPDIKAIEALMKIHGIGPAKAKSLVEENGITGIEDLKKREGLLNDKQKMGLRYWEEFDLRIPRVEMDKHADTIRTIIHGIDKKYIVELSGSYRRGGKDSGDIDVLITHPDVTIDYEEHFKNIIETCTKQKYVVDIFAQGPKKCLAVCRGKRCKHFRRIDFMMTHKNEFPFALLYFTGSGPFNVAMRNFAIEKGYSLNEYGLKCLRGPREGGFVNEGFEKEENIFSFLGLKYVKPEERIDTVSPIVL
jgi:DNA polymerase beta